jgi:hypothetical protein
MRNHWINASKKEKAWDSHSRKGKSCRRQASQAQIKALTPKLEAPYGKFYIYIYIKSIFRPDLYVNQDSFF